MSRSRGATGAVSKLEPILQPIHPRILSLQQQYAIKDNKNFDIALLHEYSLTLEIGLASITLTAFHPTERRVLTTEKYLLQHSPTTADILAALEELFKEHVFLSAGFWKEVIVVINNFKHVLVPQELFDKDKAPELMKPCVSVDLEQDELLVDEHPTVGIVNAFFMRRALKEFFAGRYPNSEVRFVHHAGLIVAALRSVMQRELSEGTKVALVVGDRQFSVSIFRQQEMRYHNSFIYTQEADFIYFILLVVRELGLDREQDQLLLYGDISTESALYEKLKLYFHKISFGSRPANLQFNFHFDELEDHQFIKFAGMEVYDQIKSGQS